MQIITHIPVEYWPAHVCGWSWLCKYVAHMHVVLFWWLRVWLIKETWEKLQHIHMIDARTLCMKDCHRFHCKVWGSSPQFKTNWKVDFTVKMTSVKDITETWSTTARMGRVKSYADAYYYTWIFDKGWMQMEVSETYREWSRVVTSCVILTESHSSSDGCMCTVPAVCRRSIQ